MNKNGLAEEVRGGSECREKDGLPCEEMDGEWKFGGRNVEGAVY